ncbi:MAG TPA: DNA mismatch repair protein MutS [Patescibacteria group bacterium]
MYKTPMLQQWHEMKEQYPDCVLFFRMGDFYEMFGDDAKIGSEVLHITLTARDKGGDGKMPMCGVPFHASENYVARLVQAGYKVAICEQVSQPGKGLVKREVVRVVTSGTLLRDESLTDAGSQFLISLVIDAKAVGGAAADLSTGQFFAFEFRGNPDDIVPLLMSHFRPRECVVPRVTYENSNYISLIRQERSANITCAHDWLVYIKDAEKLLKNHFHVQSLDTFGLSGKSFAIKGAAALLGYLRYTQKGNVEHITSIQEFHLSGHLVLDQVTLKHLEVIRTDQGEVAGSLFGAVNYTQTAAGQRLLQDWLLHPVTDIQEITARQDAVTELVSRPELVQQLRDALAPMSDSERLVGRLSVGLGSPRDLRRLADTLWHIHEQVLPLLSGVKSSRLQQVANPLAKELLEWTIRAREILFPDAKPTLDEGYIFQTGWNSELDVLRGLTSGNQEWLTQFEEQERQRTGIPKLKVVYSRAFGYAIEITKLHKDKVPPDYAPRQTLVNAERYTTQALVSYEQKALSAMDQMIVLEKQLFMNEVHSVVAVSKIISHLAYSIASLDVFVSFAYSARTHRYIRPVITEEAGLAIEGGRHPVIEHIVETDFIANDTRLAPAHSLQLITGPNMAGKSTYIRQVALIALLAHTGSFVPAQSATIGVLDRIFTRIGAHDNLRAGQSTFMVEMLETAHILHNATSRSLVILDEVGRGTSPEDGFALSWAIAEALAHQSKGLVLFATHFHALKDIAQHHTTVFNSHLAVAVDNDDLIFLRKVVDGPTDESYGIVVAEKAGVPKAIIKRAKQLRTDQDRVGKRVVSVDQLSLLAATTHDYKSKVEDKLSQIDLSATTPLQALILLNDLQASLKDT